MVDKATAAPRPTHAQPVNNVSVPARTKRPWKVAAKTAATTSKRTTSGPATAKTTATATKRRGIAATKKPPAKKHKASVPVKTLAVKSPGASVFLDTFLLDAIIDFVSVRRGYCWKRRWDATQFLTTVASVCRVLPSSYTDMLLADRYGATNQSFWMTKLFRYFDFRVDPSKSEQFKDEVMLDILNDPSWTRHRQAIRRHGISNDHFLAEKFQLWPWLHVYHRRSHYGFLTDIHEKMKPLASFPATVNAYELFQDLAVMVDELRTHGVYVEPSTRKVNAHTRQIFPCILRRMPKKITPRGSDLLDVCGIHPAFWDGFSRLVSPPWPGLPQQAHDAMAAARYSAEAGSSEMVVHAENQYSNADDYFSRWHEEAEKTQLETVVRKRLGDWRHVRIGTFIGPQFHIGKRAKTNRWMGFLAASEENM